MCYKRRYLANTQLLLSLQKNYPKQHTIIVLANYLTSAGQGCDIMVQFKHFVIFCYFCLIGIIVMDRAKQNKIYKVIGMMSGTSLDGVDLSLGNYYQNNNKWNFDLIACKTFAYQNKHVQLIKQMEQRECSYLNFRKKQLEYSQILVAFIENFISSNIQHCADIDFLSVHGHTIFHQPDEGITVQVTNLQYIAARLKMNVIGNFRELDIHHRGQGAPLVPFGQQLFEEGIYLNLGGIANVGYKGKGHDIVFCNMILNRFSQKIDNKPYDSEGKLGRSGESDAEYFEELKKIYRNSDQHSLARQEVQKYLQQIEKSTQSNQILRNKLRTFYQFISYKIIQDIISLCKQQDISIEASKLSVICTGGGAYNKFLIQLLNKNSQQIKFVVPDSYLVQFKEAIIFGLLGVKFAEGQNNCKNGVGGQLIKGKIN